jgi:hypothetical protein
MLVAEILQVTLAGLVANRTVERVVDEKKFDHSLAGFQQIGRRVILHLHSVHDGGAATGHGLGHGSWVLFGTLGDFDDASTAIPPARFELGIIAHSRRCYLSADHARGLENGGTLRYFYAVSVDGDFRHGAGLRR